MLQAETAANPDRMRRALAGLARYQQAERSAPPAPMPAIAAIEGASLRDYGGKGPPVLFVPSLINPPSVLDLGEKSLLRWLAARGYRILLMDWGWPDAARSAFSVAAHVERILLPLMDALNEPADLVGYCLGGTMAAAAARPGGARGLATIAAPWHFNGFDNESRAALARLWDQSRTVADALGVLPMEVLQSAFWNLDPARTVAKFEAFSAMSGDQAAAFVALEDWANDGPPLPKAAAREMMEDLFGADLTGTGQWRVAGETVDPARIEAPMLHVVSTTDRIVPHASAFRSGARLDLALGHVGMVVGSRGREALWEPLAAWLSRTAAKC